MRVITLSLVLAATLLSYSPGNCVELRTVGGKDVDIQPVLDWAAAKKGERPMKHWKRVQLLEFKRQSLFPALLCDIEGNKTEILLKNCPHEVLEQLTQKQSIETRLAAARKEHASAAEELANSHKRRDVQQAKRNEASATESEKTAKKELDELDQKIRKHQGVYAMATGASADQLPIWDTGLRSP